MRGDLIRGQHLMLARLPATSNHPAAGQLLTASL